MKNENFSQILEISSIFQNFLTLFLKISRHFVISWQFLRNSGKFSSNFRRKIADFIEKREWKMKFHFHSGKNLDGFLLKFWNLSGAKECKSCRSRKSWKNEYLVAIVAVDTAENEPLKVWGRFHSSFIRLLSNYRGSEIIKDQYRVSQRSVWRHRSTRSRRAEPKLVANWGILGECGISPELRQSRRPPTAALRLPYGCPTAALRLRYGCPTDSLRIPYGFSKFCEILVKFRRNFVEKMQSLNEI